MKGDASKVILIGEAERLEIAAPEWANVLLTLEDWGWRPRQRMRTFYLGTGIEVSAEDAADMLAAGGRLQHAALTDPLRTYPVRADMGEISNVVEFCRAGGFRIEKRS